MDVCLSGFVADKVFNADKVYKVCNVDTPVQSPGYLLAGAESAFQPFWNWCGLKIFDFASSYW